MAPLASLLPALVFLSLAAGPARADDALDPAMADASSLPAPDFKDKWGAQGAQQSAARGADDAPAASSAGGASPAAAPTPDQILSAWAHDCPAIAAFQASKGAPSQRRGIGVPASSSDGGAIVERLRARWYFTRGTAPLTGSNAEFVPMIDAAANGADDADNKLRELAQVRPAPKYLLAYHEPDLAHVSADDKSWTQFYAPRLPALTAVSPASSAVNDWFNSFVKSEGTKDFPHVAIHIYEDFPDNDPGRVDSAVADFKRQMKIVEASKKPVWVTAFGLSTRGASQGDPAKFTDAQAACFMAQVIPYLEQHAARYAWSSPAPNAQAPQDAILPDALWDRDGALTPLGELYKQ